VGHLFRLGYVWGDPVQCRGRHSKLHFLEILSHDPCHVSWTSAQPSRSLTVLKMLTSHRRTDARTNKQTFDRFYKSSRHRWPIKLCKTEGMIVTKIRINCLERLHKEGKWQYMWCICLLATSNLLAKQFFKFVSDRFEGEFVDGLAIRASKMTH